MRGLAKLAPQNSASAVTNVKFGGCGRQRATTTDKIIPVRTKKRFLFMAW